MTGKFWLRGAVLVLAVALPPGLLRAQDAVPLPGPATPGPTPDGKWYPYGPLEVQEISAATPRHRRPVNTVLRYFGACCWSDVNHVGCGSLKSECTYVFGSCRSFYKEQCEAPPPHPWFRDTGAAPQSCGCGD